MQPRPPRRGPAAALAAAPVLALALGLAAPALARTVEVTLTAQEVPTVIDNKGTTQASWTFDGKVPGPVIRVTEGDMVAFTLVNPKTNKNAHSLEVHGAGVNLLDAFAPVEPGGAPKTFRFEADRPGVFLYHCGAPNMAQHVARGMFGVMIVDPRKYTREFPKPDREYVLIQSELYPNGDADRIMAGQWSNVVFNGTILKYDPIHDPGANRTLVAKPGELVRVFFANAGPSEFAAFHPEGGIWERAYPSGNPANVLHRVQTLTVAPGDAAALDLVSPVAGANALITHSLKAALTGAIAVIVFSEDADPSLGVWNGDPDAILVR